MLNTVCRSWLIGASMAAVALIITVGMATGANLSTIVLLLALGVAPAIVTVVIAGSASPPNVAEILRAADMTPGPPPSPTQERLASLCSE